MSRSNEDIVKHLHTSSSIGQTVCEQMPCKTKARATPSALNLWYRRIPPSRNMLPRFAIRFQGFVFVWCGYFCFSVHVKLGMARIDCLLGTSQTARKKQVVTISCQILPPGFMRQSWVMHHIQHFGSNNESTDIYKHMHKSQSFTDFWIATLGIATCWQTHKVNPLAKTGGVQLCTPHRSNGGCKRPKFG